MANDNKVEVESRLVHNLDRLSWLARYLLGKGNPIEPEDVVQRTCERVLSRWSQWSGEGFDTWVRTILVSQIREEAGREAVRETSDLDDLAELDDPAAAANVEAILTRQDILRIWPQLSLKYREVLLFIGLEGYSNAEVAKMLGIPIRTVLTRMRRARRIAQRLLAET